MLMDDCDPVPLGAGWPMQSNLSSVFEYLTAIGLVDASEDLD